MHNAPAGALACHCIELSLKAVLLGVNLLMPHYAPLRRGFSLRGSPAVPAGPLSRELFCECSGRLINTTPNSTSGLTEIATIHSTVYSPRVPVSDGLRGIDINGNTA